VHNLAATATADKCTNNCFTPSSKPDKPGVFLSHAETGAPQQVASNMSFVLTSVRHDMQLLILHACTEQSVLSNALTPSLTNASAHL
jgi:hypothetical protein